MKNAILMSALLLVFGAQLLLGQASAPSASSQSCSTDGGCPPNPRPAVTPSPNPMPAAARQLGIQRINPRAASRGASDGGGCDPCLEDGDCGDPCPTPTPPPPPLPHLNYYGGPVISNVHVVEVLYGTGSYLPQVSSTAAPSIASFFSDILGPNSNYINLLTQYNTPAVGGTNQTIGNGSFDGLFQIVPSAPNNLSSLTDLEIQNELLAQITAGHLPAPLLDAAGNVNTLYMIYFPPGVTITLDGATSCVGNGFCAYHGTTSNTLNSRNVLYGVFPDQQSGGCSTLCGGSSTFGNYTSLATHELAEAITDADAELAIGLPNFPVFPLAWFDPNYNEIGDICNQQQGPYNANGTTYTIQLLFSNAASDCVLPPPAPFFTLSASAASPTLIAGYYESTTHSTITVTPSGGFTGAVTLSASGLPVGVTASFSANPTTSKSALTLTASTTTTMPGTATVTITGTSGTLTNTTTLPLNIPPLASPVTGTAPLTVSFAGGSNGTFPLDHWDFGDGTTSPNQGLIIVHTYLAPGTYTASPFYAPTGSRLVPVREILVDGPSVTITVF